MTTSFEEIQRTEQYIFGQMAPEDKLVFEAQLLTNATLRMNAFFQRKVYHVLKLFMRREVRQQVETLHDRIFNDPAKAEMQQNILNFFNP